MSPVVTLLSMERIVDGGEAKHTEWGTSPLNRREAPASLQGRGDKEKT